MGTNLQIMTHQEQGDTRKAALVQAYSYLELDTGSAKSDEKAADILAEYLDKLIVSDFNRLLALLYRIDVSGEKIKSALSYRSKDLSAGRIFADLMIDRLRQKLAFRQAYHAGTTSSEDKSTKL